MAPPHVNIDPPASLTAKGKATVPAQPPTATSGSLSAPIGNAPNVSTETARPSTDNGDDDNSSARSLALAKLLAMISREAKLGGLEPEPREQADERLARRPQHPPNPVGVNTLIKPTEALHGKAVADTAAARQTSRPTMFDGIGTTVGIDFAGLSKTQIKKQLPHCWCMQCLADHPYPDKAGRHHHICSLRDNVAMHEAIRAGDLPPVDPWHDILEALKVAHPPLPPPPPPPQPLEPIIRTATFEPTEEDAKLLKQAREGDGSMSWLLEFVERKNEAIDRRNEALQPQPRPLASYANAAPAAFNSTYPLPGARMQPTGPPRKKRKAQAHGDNQNPRFKRKYAINFRDSVIQKAQTPDCDDDQTVLEALQMNDVPENSTSSKIPQTDEAATAVNQTAAFKKLT
jgi:hypothetical protein